MSLKDWEHVEEYKQSIIDGNVLASIWQIGDIQVQAVDTKYAPISDEDARNILAIIEARHDANIGINWDIITYHTENYFDNKK